MSERRKIRDRLDISAKAYQRVTLVALVALSAIVLTGAAVRLTGSGLGCPDWPKCYGKTVPPLEYHAVIEYGNRLITGLVGFAVIAAAVLSVFRRPYRRHLVLSERCCRSASWARRSSAPSSSSTTCRRSW